MLPAFIRCIRPFTIRTSSPISLQVIPTVMFKLRRPFLISTRCWGAALLPSVAITSHTEEEWWLAADLVTLQARITDKGKGVGRIEWRVNGVTAA